MPPGALDLRARAGAERVGDDEQGGRQLAAAEDLHRPVEPPDEAGGAQDLLVDRDRRGALLRALRAGHVAGLELTELDEAGDVADVDDLELDLERVLEAAQLRDPLVERRLAALEPGRDLPAGASLLALRAATRGLALAGRDAAADAALGGPRPGRGLQVMELHLLLLVDSAAPRGLLDGHEEADLADHPAGRIVGGHLDGRPDAVQAERAQRRRGCGRCG